MVEVQSIKIPAHKNIYSHTNTRDLRIDFGIPDNPNANTGLFLLVPGFGGEIDSKVYQKLLRELPNKYNVVAIQCDYFGNNLMQEVKEETFVDLREQLTNLELNECKKGLDALYRVLSTKNITANAIAHLKETTENFVDFSFMQSIDIITALESMIIILEENNIAFNKSRILAYGQSHGAYLILLVNRIAPHLFSYIIDNSAWLYPKYLSDKRIIITKIGNSSIYSHYKYQAGSIFNIDQLNLMNIYEDFDSKAAVFSVLGSDDQMINREEKTFFLNKICEKSLEYIEPKDVDGKIYKSTGHGLDADFFELINHAIEEDIGYENKSVASKNYNISFNNVMLNVNYNTALPIFTLTIRGE